MTIREADAGDVDALVRLINAAFEVERFFKVGDRTSEPEVRALMTKGTMLIAGDRAAAEAANADAPAGSVFVEIRGDHVYIGMVSVDPRRQRTGIGHALMAAAEDYGRARGSVAADITVVNLRTDLLPFYHRLGYVETGTAPFPPGQRASRECHLLTLSKRLDLNTP
jgi:GNAT superfamily N-acetyltransferase